MTFFICWKFLSSESLFLISPCLFHFIPISIPSTKCRNRSKASGKSSCGDERWQLICVDCCSIALLWWGLTSAYKPWIQWTYFLLRPDKFRQWWFWFEYHAIRDNNGRESSSILYFLSYSEKRLIANVQPALACFQRNLSLFFLFSMICWFYKMPSLGSRKVA